MKQLFVVAVLAFCSIVLAAAEPSGGGALVAHMSGQVLTDGRPTVVGTAVLVGERIRVLADSAAELVWPGAAIRVGASSDLRLGEAVELASGLVEVAGRTAVASGGWTLRADSDNVRFTVIATPEAVFASVLEGGVTIAGRDGGTAHIEAGKAVRLDRQTATPTASHHKRNMIIGSAVGGGIAAAIIAYHETHKTQVVGPCLDCQVSPSQ